MRQLYTYEEIQDIECYEDGSDFIIKQLPEYLFTWQKGNTWVNLWVTNNIQERQYSFYQFVKTLDLLETSKVITENGERTIGVVEMHFIVGMFAEMLYEAKQTNQLDEEYYFETGKTND